MKTGTEAIMYYVSSWTDLGGVVEKAARAFQRRTGKVANAVWARKVELFQDGHLPDGFRALEYSYVPAKMVYVGRVES